ncbi:MAG: hypothetical protein HZC40_14995 [Chloroflexi bacterium]|nr:hypothetical protein [Chloroflexota bacterium]
MNTAREFLLQSQNADGGWGYRVGAMSFVEPTAAALIALRDENTFTLSEVEGRARDFLIAHQHADGGWGIAPMDAESGWMTAWAIRALAHSGGANDAIARGAQWLLATQVLRVEESANRAQIKQLLAIDSTLRGFPWQPGDASWVQPTALAILALVAAGQRDHARVREGIEYLFDRASARGGWNVGNPWMIGKAMPVTIQDTALALSALRSVQIAASDARVIAALAFVRAASARVTTAAELTWTLVALRDWQLEIEDVRARLNALQRADGSWQGNPFITAIAMSSEM